MEPVKISKDSLHFRLATVYGPLTKWDITREKVDFCGYIKAVLKGSLSALAWTVFAAAAGWALGDALAWLMSGLLHGFVKPNIAGMVAMVVIAIVAVLVAWIILDDITDDFLYSWRQAKRVADKTAPKAQNKSSPGFIKLAYRSLKDRYCVRVALD